MEEDNKKTEETGELDNDNKTNSDVALEERKKELIEIEKRIETKIRDFKENIQKIEAQGKGRMEKQKTKEEKLTEECNRRLKGTGLQI